MSRKELSVAEELALGAAMKQNIENVESQLSELPWNHPARIAYDLDRQIVRENSSPFGNYETELAMGFMRQSETDNQVHSQRESIVDAGDAALSDLDKGIKQSYRDAHPFDDDRVQRVMNEITGRKAQLESEYQADRDSQLSEIREHFNGRGGK